MGLGLILEEMGKDVTIVLVDGVPARFRFLPESERIQTDPKAPGPYDLILLCDSASYERAGYPLREEGLAPRLAQIDHHITNPAYADVNWIDPRSSSTSELVFFLAKELEVKLTPAIGRALMTGISTDTGFLKYPAATPRTVRVVAELIELGVDHARMYRDLFEETPFGVQKLVGRALTRCQSLHQGKVLWTWLSQDDAQEFDQAGPLASIGVGPLCPIQGAEVVLCFELQDKGAVVEFRSRNQIPVDGIARAFGGGGHAKASGCFLEGDFDSIRERVLEAVEALLRGA